MLYSSVSPCAISSRVQNHVRGDALQALLLLLYVQKDEFVSFTRGQPTYPAPEEARFCLLIKLRRECMWFLGWT